MARSAQSDLFVARLLALGFAALSTLASWSSLRGVPLMLIAAQVCTILSIAVLAGVRARIGWRSTYAHPMAKVTLALLVPAQLMTALWAMAGLRI
jgi:hypothetical protein